jgi:hypothetical protein
MFVGCKIDKTCTVSISDEIKSLYLFGNKIILKKDRFSVPTSTWDAGKYRISSSSIQTSNSTCKSETAEKNNIRP